MFTTIALALVMLVAGFVLLVKGADWFVDGAATLAEKLGIPQLVVGLTIVAMGTSLPEAAVSISAGLKGNAGITVGNIVGSNIMNVLVILGVTALIVNVKIQMSTLKVEIPFMLAITVVFMAAGLTGNVITFPEGVILWILFIIYLIYLYFLSKKNGSEGSEDEIKNMPIWKCLLLIVIGAMMVVLGSNFVVDGATAIARAIGMSERFIGLTIVAFGTSLPELVTSVSAARKGNADIAIGNIVGSNVFNILFVVGTVALVCPVPFENKFIIDSIVAVAAGVVLWLAAFRHKELRRPAGVIMLLMYAGYFVWLCR